MGRALLYYKLKQAYRQKRRMGRQLRNARKLKSYMAATETLKPGSTASKLMFGDNWAAASDAQKANRRAVKYYGDGDYRDWLRYGSRGIGALAGGANAFMSSGWGGLSGGIKSGWDQGSAFSKYMGWGDYSANQIIDGGSGNQQQISVNQSDLTGDIFVARTEFVQNVVATGTSGQPSGFQLTSFALNPGLSKTFPWLSQIAQNFTLYEFAGLIFQFKPLFSEDAGTSSSLGKVIMATNYDPEAPTFITSVQMENYDYSNSCKPSMGMHHGVETANHQQALNLQYVRTGATTRSLIFTDIGNFQLATEGIPLTGTSAILGELWVTYRVKLSRAEIYGSLLGNNILSDYYEGTTNAAQLTTGTVYSGLSNNIGITVFPVSATAVRILFPVSISLGYFKVTMVFNSGGTPFTNQVFIISTTPSNLQFYTPGQIGLGSTSILVQGPNALTATTNAKIMATQYVYVNSPGLAQASFQMNVSSALTATTTWELYVEQTSQNFVNS